MIEPTFSPATPATPAPEEDVTTALYRAAIGPVSGNYYLPIFTRFEAADHAGISWNHAASLATLNWLVFRKLWVAALAYVGILVAVAVLVFGMGHLVFQFSDTLMMALALGFGVAAFVLPGLFGNAVLHTECRKAMAKALAAHTHVADACAELTRQASTRRRALWLAGANAAVLLAVGLAYLQFSALNSLTVMPQGALEAGHVSVGGMVESASSGAPSMPVASNASAAASATAPNASAPVVALAASEPQPTSSAVAPMAATSSAPTSTAAALPMAAASSAPTSMAAATPVVPPSAPAATAPSVKTVAMATSAPAMATPLSTAVAASSAPAVAATQVAAVAPTNHASKPKSKSSAAKEAPTAMAAVQVRAKKEAEKSAKPSKTPEAPTSAGTTTAQKRGKPAPAPAPATADAGDKPFYINVGLFAKPENAANAHAKLLEAKLPSVTTPLKASKLHLIRVRVGPFNSRSEAESAVEKIKALELDAVIIQL